MLTGWKRLNKDQREHMKEAHLRYDDDAVTTFRWHSIAGVDSQIKGFHHGHPVCWGCASIAKALGYAYRLCVLEDVAGWWMIDQPVVVVRHYTTPWK